MSRRLGPLLLVVVLIACALERWHEHARAETLLTGEAHARATLSALADVSAPFLASGAVHPGLTGEVLASLPELVPLPDLSTADLSYARDEAYMYGFATRPHHDDASGRARPGYVLRAWPLFFGRTGDLEYQLGDDGQLWEGQNRLGRSGTTYGFPPTFPEPGIGQARAPWWPVPLPAHM